ncbi:MAG: hypothetical protein AB8U25_00175 [Rickettsiales endosymbiont of Dermacentor nuttalli]
MDRDAQEEFIKLFCKEFRLGRNAIESIAKGKSISISDNVDKLKNTSRIRAIVLNVSSLSYL